MEQDLSGELILYPLGDNPTKMLLERALRRVEGHDFRKILHISPKKTKRDFAEFEFARMLKENLSIPPEFATLSGIAEDIARRWTGRAVVRRTLSGLILWEEVRKDEELLLAFSGGARDINLGTALMILDFFNEVRDYLDKEGQERLKEAIGEDLYEHDRLRRRTEGALNFLPRYQEALEREGVLDSRESIISALNAPFEELPNPEVLILDGFLEWTPLEKSFIKRLVERTPYFLVALPDPESCPEGREILEASLGFIHRFRGLREVREGEERPLPEKLWAFSSLRSEVQALSRSIKVLLFEHPEKEILVTGPNMTLYGPRIEEALSLSGIPFCSRLDLPIIKDPGLSIFLDTLQSVMENYERRAVLRILRSPYLGVEADLRPWLDGLTRTLGIVEGREEWESLEERLNLLKGDEDGLEDLPRWIERLKPWVERFLECTRDFGREGTPRDFARWFRGFWRAMEGKVSLGEGTPLTEILSELERIRGISLTPSRFLPFLKRLILEETFQVEPNPFAPVQVIDLRSTRGLDGDHVFFVGLRDGDMPTRMEPDPFLPEKTRGRVGLPGYAHHYHLQALDFHRVIRSGREAVHLSYSRTVAGRASIPSIFTDFLKEETRILSFEEGIFSPEDDLRFKSFDERESYLDWLREERNMKPLFEEGKKRLKERSRFSVTALERFGKCPFRFFHEDLLGLSLKEEPGPELDPKALGILAHRVLEALYGERRLEVDEIELKVTEALNRVSEEAGLKGIWREALLRYFLGRLNLLRGVEEEESKEGFSVGGVEKWISSVLFDGVEIVGKIDRLDVAHKRARLLDFKTGDAPSPHTNLLDGLQLLLYGILFKRKFPEFREIEVAFVSLKSGEAALSLNPIPLLPSLEKETLERGRELLLRAQRGDFRAEPFKGEYCRWCIFSLPGEEFQGRCPYWMRRS